jgi:hypothetical protein
VRAAIVGLVLVLGLSACSSRATGGGGNDGSLSDEELAFARAIVHDEASVEGANISSVTAAVRPGTVTDSNVGRPCTSGRLLELKLIGTFPHIVTSGHPVRPGEHADFTVTAVVITADADTGQVCLKGVQTGDVETEPGAEHIPLG